MDRPGPGKRATGCELAMKETRTQQPSKDTSKKEKKDHEHKRRLVDWILCSSDAAVHLVGKIEPVGSPTFVGNDLYFSGSEQLRRIRKIIPGP